MDTQSSTGKAKKSRGGPSRYPLAFLRQDEKRHIAPRCHLCGGAIATEGREPETTYERAGVCVDCVRWLANEYCKECSGEPDRRFCTAEEWAEHVTAREDRKRRKVAERARRDAENAPRLALVPAGAVPESEILAARTTPFGGWSRKVLENWGVPWPPPRGWRKRLERPGE